MSCVCTYREDRISHVHMNPHTRVVKSKMGTYKDSGKRWSCESSTKQYECIHLRIYILLTILP